MLEQEKKTLSGNLLWLMTIGAGLVVANNYYNQPLLGMIANELGRSEAATSKIAMFTQIGYATGLFLIIPLGDMFRRKRIVLIDLVLVILSLIVFAFAQSLEVLIISSFFIGVTSVIPQIFVPIAAQLSAPGKKDKNVAKVMTGLLVGILASRVFSGIIGEHLGWRKVFLIAAVMMFVLGIFVIRLLPDLLPTFKGSYLQLVRSILYYVKKLPSLRLASIRGGLGFASFSAFWTVLVFRLEQAPYFVGSDVAGVFGLAGIMGAMGAALAGYASAKFKQNTIIIASALTMVVAWLIIGTFDYLYLGLIIGVILLDLGLAFLNVTNQFVVYSSHPEAANRLNTVYMVSYFIGGSLGTFCSGIAWSRFGWNGVFVVGAGFVVLCLIAHILLRNKK